MIALERLCVRKVDVNRRCGLMSVCGNVEIHKQRRFFLSTMFGMEGRKSKGRSKQENASQTFPKLFKTTHIK